ncbi:MAG: class I SAM-dependent DNA methyltransferase, partial [Clostridia bacterium]|nr:class I SAM-dependent DNA methyltransferase [Clostridia bacterium]
EDFPCQIAQVGMWLMDHQMNTRAAEQFGTYYARLPLTQSATIVHGNALRIDWEEVVPKRELSYILGNPPFVGHKNVNPTQKQEMIDVFNGKQGRLDYVSAWYKKAAEMIVGTSIECAFVSTNSIVQGVHIELLWGLLFDYYGIHINFAHTTFKWSNEAKGKASVFCVIVGFSTVDRNRKRLFVYEDIAGMPIEKIVKKINAYLNDGEAVIVQSRNTTLCDVPKMIYGNIPRDGGHYTFTDDEKMNF